MSGATSKSNMNVSITSSKSTRAKLKRIQKTEGTIKKLFNQLRHQSKDRLSSSKPGNQSCETSVIEIEDSILNNTVNELSKDVTFTETHRPGNVETVKSGNMTQTIRLGNKRCSKLKTIVINNDEPGVSTPQKNISFHHSTPIKYKSIDDLIVEVNNQLSDNSNNNRTKEINASSFLTIDLTMDSGFNKSTQPTIIDLDSTNNQDCVLTSVRYVTI